MASFGHCSGLKMNGSLLEEEQVGQVSLEIGGSWLENAEQHWRRMLEGQSSGRGLEGSRDTLYGTFLMSERHKNESRTPCS